MAAKNIAEVRERNASLSQRCDKLTQQAESLLEKQRGGDFSAETAREIGITLNSIEVLKNRIAGRFEGRDAEARNCEISLPKFMR